MLGHVLCLYLRRLHESGIQGQWREASPVSLLVVELYECRQHRLDCRCMGGREDLGRCCSTYQSQHHQAPHQRQEHHGLHSCLLILLRPPT